jgi:hypothetical protein
MRKMLTGNQSGGRVVWRAFCVSSSSVFSWLLPALLHLIPAVIGQLETEAQGSETTCLCLISWKSVDPGLLAQGAILSICQQVERKVPARQPVSKLREAEPMDPTKESADGDNGR